MSRKERKKILRGLKSRYGLSYKDVEKRVAEIIGCILSSEKKETYSTMSIDVLEGCIKCGSLSTIVSTFINIDLDSEDFLEVGMAGYCKECFREVNSGYKVENCYDNHNRATLEAIFTQEEIEKFEEGL